MKTSDDQPKVYPREDLKYDPEKDFLGAGAFGAIVLDLETAGSLWPWKYLAFRSGLKSSKSNKGLGVRVELDLFYSSLLLDKAICKRPVTGS